jgi:hypothetical protein
METAACLVQESTWTSSSHLRPSALCRGC